MSSETGIAPRRLHPAGIAVLGVDALKDLALPLGIAFASMVLGGGGGQPLPRAIAFGVLGAVVVLLSATSFSRALVRMYVRIWDAPRPPTLRSLWRLIAALLGFVLLILVLTAVRRALAGVPLSGLAEGLVAFVFGGLLWTWVPWVLLARRVRIRMLVPGGVLMAVAMVLLTVAGQVYLPRALSSATRQFGALGVSFTYLTWLFVIMIALVASTAVGAVVARDPGPFARVVDGAGEAAPGPRR